MKKADRSPIEIVAEGAVNSPLQTPYIDDREACSTGLGQTIDYELLIVGAGPHALSLVTKLMEEQKDELEESPNNSNLFKISADNHIEAKYKVLPDGKFLQKDETIRNRWGKSSRSKKQHDALLQNVCVIDRNDTWCAQWKNQFKMLGIPYLRSTLAAHPDPLDPQCMRVYIEATSDRCCSVLNIQVDRSTSYQGPFEVPKTDIYNKFTDEIVKRYHLENAITKGDVTNVKLIQTRQAEKDKEAAADEKKVNDIHIDKEVKDSKHQYDHHFEVKVKDTTGERIVTTRNVVFATGPLNTPVFPEFYSELDDEEKARLLKTHKIYHSCNIIWAHLEKEDRNRGENINDFENLLIIGGGLTAGHLATRAIHTCVKDKEKAKHVTLFARRPLQTRQFDLDLDWMGQKRASNLASFWSSSDYDKRLQTLANAKNGGSMTPELQKELEKGKETGCFTLYEETDIQYAYFDETIQKWEVLFKGYSGEEGLFYYDVIWCATGTKPDITSEKSIFKGLSEEMEIVGGKLPKLTNELRIKEGINAFVLGQLAGLILGPGSLNLMGGRAGAARVAEALKANSLGDL